MRDLSRAREDAVTDRGRAQHRLSKLLLRRGVSHGNEELAPGGSRVAARASFNHPAAQAPFDDFLRTLEAAKEQARTRDDYREAVRPLRCFREVDTVPR